MTENKAERVYWYGLLLTLASSPVLVVIIYTRELNLDFSPLYLVGIFILSELVQFPLEIALSPQRISTKFWVKNPSVSVTHSSRQKPEGWQQEMRGRMESLGFRVVPTERQGWFIRKPKAAPAYGFLDHEFDGRVMTKHGPFGVETAITLTLADTLVVDTGERTQLRQLAEYLAGIKASPTLPTFHLVLACAAFLAIASHVLVYAHALELWPGKIPVYEACYGALGMAVWMLVVMLRRKHEFTGFRVLYGSLVAAAIPVAAALFKSGAAAGF